MIGRSLDAILSPMQLIAREFRRGGEDSILFHMLNATRGVVLPVNRLEYINNSLYSKGWSAYFEDQWALKRQCAKAFEQRRKVAVGETFPLTTSRITDYGGTHDVKRVASNVVQYRHHIIASSQDDLMKYRREDCDPVLYRAVLW